MRDLLFMPDTGRPLPYIDSAAMFMYENVDESLVDELLWHYLS